MKLRPQDAAIAQELLGYLNFSGGRPDPKFQKNLDEFLIAVPFASAAEALRQVLSELHATSPAFADSSQAEQVISLTFDQTLPAGSIVKIQLIQEDK